MLITANGSYSESTQISCHQLVMLYQFMYTINCFLCFHLFCVENLLGAKIRSY